MCFLGKSTFYNSFTNLYNVILQLIKACLLQLLISSLFFKLVPENFFFFFFYQASCQLHKINFKNFSRRCYKYICWHLTIFSVFSTTPNFVFNSYFNLTWYFYFKNDYKKRFLYFLYLIYFFN